MGKRRKINATHYDEIPAFPAKLEKSDYRVHAIIETPKGSCHKYALKEGYGIIAFHDVLPKDMEWPYDYGFVPHTLAPDGDALDIVVINQRGLFSGCFIETRLLGAIRQTKDGIENDRLIAVPLASPGAPQPTDAVADISDLPTTLLHEIMQFLKSYSDRQGHSIEVKSVAGAREAMQIVKKGVKKFKKGRTE